MQKYNKVHSVQTWVILVQIGSCLVHFGSSNLERSKSLGHLGHFGPSSFWRAKYLEVKELKKVWVILGHFIFLVLCVDYQLLTKEKMEFGSFGSFLEGALCAKGEKGRSQKT